MKSNSNMKITILMILITIFVLSPIFIINLNFDDGINDKINLDNENLKNSVVSERIHINGNSGWLDFKNAGKCTGNGSSSDPYVIKDLVINATGFGSGIIIENSDVYFKIENCTLFHSGSQEIDAGIKLDHVKYGQIINNTSYGNRKGIYITQCDNNTFIGNIFSNNVYGIYMEYSFDNSFYLNSIEAASGDFDIYFMYSTNTWNSQKKMLYTYQGKNYTNYLGNYWSGYDAYDRDNDGIADNRFAVLGFHTRYDLYDYYPLMEPLCNYEIHKIIDPSEETTNGGKIPGYNILFLIGIISSASIIFYKKLKKSCN